jgi:hypothetical protein
MWWQKWPPETLVEIPKETKVQQKISGLTHWLGEVHMTFLEPIKEL